MQKNFFTQAQAESGTNFFEQIWDSNTTEELRDLAEHFFNVRACVSPNTYDPNYVPFDPNVDGQYGVSTLYGSCIFQEVIYRNSQLKDGIYINVIDPDGSNNEIIQVVAPLETRDRLSWKSVSAMIMVESDPSFILDARLLDPMQVANEGDPALEALSNDREASLWITNVGFRDRLRNTQPTPFDNNGLLDYSQGSPPLIDAKTSIQAGITWLLVKASITEYEGSLDGESFYSDNVQSNGAVISDWNDDLDAAIDGYNGGGNPLYLEEVNEAESLYQSFLDSFN
ncbi:MAG: hypothetical protein AAF728_14365 [Cyanobacteria bacterium P01_D01_bin.128]